VRILIELNRTEDDRVEGVVSTEGSDEASSFSGWLELLALLETMGMAEGGRAGGSTVSPRRGIQVEVEPG